MGRLLGLDVGERRIGVALSDPGGVLASALPLIERKGDNVFSQIAAMVAEHQVQAVVVGLPRSLDGSLGSDARRVQAFVERLSQEISVPVEKWDERLSTVAAEKMLVGLGMKWEKRKERRDSVAAALVLQSYLDWLRREDSPGTREGEAP